MATSTTTTSTQTTISTKPRLRYLGGTRYLVESTSQPGLGRQVDTLRLKCSCPASTYGRRCSHLILALAYEEWRRRQQQQPAPQAPAVPGVPPQTSQPVAPSSYFE